MAGERTDDRTVSVQITLETWDKSVKVFLEQINFFANQTTHDLLRETFNEFRQKIAAPSAEAPADFPQLRATCAEIIKTNVPEYHMPRIQNTMQTFLGAFAAMLAASLAIGLVLILAAKFTALLGLVTLASVNFKTLFASSVTLGAIGGLLAAGSMFAPRQHATRMFERFSRNITPSTEDTTAQAQFG